MTVYKKLIIDEQKYFSAKANHATKQREEENEGSWVMGIVCLFSLVAIIGVCGLAIYAIGFWSILAIIGILFIASAVFS